MQSLFKSLTLALVMLVSRQISFKGLERGKAPTPQNLFGEVLGQLEAEETIWHVLDGRTTASLYRVCIPTSWKKLNQAPSLQDTTVALITFEIEEGLLLAIHNFPISRLNESIAPSAQIARWKRQFDKLDTASSGGVFPQSFSGYTGALFEGYGQKGGKDYATLAWALNIGRSHFYQLEEDGRLEALADVTIKAWGEKSLVQKHRDSILQAARSFELCEEIFIK